MNLIRKVFVGGLLVAAMATASAQFVKGNEAVRVMPDGSTSVETPPLPSVKLGQPCPANKGGCTASGWKMLETDRGVAECTEVFARPGTCRPSTYGAEKRSRTWIVKSKGQWLQCDKPEISRSCVSLKSLPISAVQ